MVTIVAYGDEAVDVSSYLYQSGTVWMAESLSGVCEEVLYRGERDSCAYWGIESTGKYCVSTFSYLWGIIVLYM